jgi:hypothetical protein
MALLASILPPEQLSKLSPHEYEVLQAHIDREVESNQQIKQAIHKLVGDLVVQMRKP